MCIYSLGSRVDCQCTQHIERIKLENGKLKSSEVGGRFFIHLLFSHKDQVTITLWERMLMVNWVSKTV